MHDAPILLIGGSGIVGRRTAGLLRDAAPAARLLIGGRDPARARAVAAAVGNADAVAVDLGAADLALGERPVAAVAVFLKDDSLASLRFALARGIPHVGISSGTFEIGPEVSAFVHHPDAAPVVLGSEWLVGAATVPALHLARRFERLQEIRIDAVLDEQDIGGPAAEIDMVRLTRFAPAALTRRGGAFHWRAGDGLAARIRAADGTVMDGFGYSPLDVAALAAATGAPDVEFNVAVGQSSSRRRGEAMSTEIIVSLAGVAADGSRRRERHTIIHPEGQAPLTALGVAMLIERLAGLDGRPPTPPGLYFPEQLLEPASYLARLAAIGGRILEAEIEQ